VFVEAVHAAQEAQAKAQKALQMVQPASEPVLPAAGPGTLAAKPVAIAPITAPAAPPLALAVPIAEPSTTAPVAPTTALATPPVTTYIVSSATLAEAYSYLTQRRPGAAGEPEWMLAVTGVKQGQTRTLEQLIEVKLASQSGARAAFDMEDFTRVAVTLHEHGQALHSVWHSHRHNGSPHPSGIDMALQRLLDDGGYPTIQAVFSEDGYVRFFGGSRPFAIQVHGKGVQPVERESNLYHIVERGTLPHPRLAAPKAR
jgi:hypothetical protein